MSFIDTIEIKNFKSIRHQKIEGCKRINLFIGYPNVGKSNILEALGMAMYIKSDIPSSLHDICRYRDLRDLFFDGNRFSDAEFWINDIVISLRYKSNIEIELVAIEKQNYIENFNETNSKLLVSRRINTQGFQTATNFANNLLLDLDVRKYKFNAAEEVNKSPSASGYSTPKTLSAPLGENLSEVIRFNKEIRIEAGKLFADYNLKLVIDDNQQLIVQKQLDEFSAFQFPYLQVADTLQRLIFYKAAVMSNREAAIILEEPESHMFPPYISKLTTDLIFDERKNQYFLTTHSPFVLNDFIEELPSEELAIFAVGYNKNKGETIVKRFGQEEIKEVYDYGVDLFFNLEDYLKDVVT